MENKFISFFKIAFNPFRVLSLFFEYISKFFGFFADLFDKTSNEIFKGVNETEESIKNIPMHDIAGKIVIIICIFCLFLIWYDYLYKGTI